MKLLQLVFFVITMMALSSVSIQAQTASASKTTCEPIISKMKVKGVTCSSDVKTLAKNVEKLDGVSKCKALKKGATSTFEITFDPNLTSEEDIKKAFEDTAGCKNPNDRPYKVKE